MGLQWSQLPDRDYGSDYRAVNQHGHNLLLRYIDHGWRVFVWTSIAAERNGDRPIAKSPDGYAIAAAAKQFADVWSQTLDAAAGHRAAQSVMYEAYGPGKRD